MLQDPLLFDTSVFDNVASGLRFRGMEKSRNPVARRDCGWNAWESWTSDETTRKPSLSGGEAQRVSLARALVLEPELLLLDEPFSALDPPTHKRLLAELSSLLDEIKTTTVFITHDLNEALQLGQRMAVILNGRSPESGLTR